MRIAPSAQHVMRAKNPLLLGAVFLGDLIDVFFAGMLHR
jgi:hypothetical protein